MSLSEKMVIHTVQQYSDEQLLDIKAHGYNSDEYKRLEETADAKYYRTFTLGRVADELITRGLMSPGAELEFWWEAWTGY